MDREYHSYIPDLQREGWSQDEYRKIRKVLLESATSWAIVCEAFADVPALILSSLTTPIPCWSLVP